MNLESVFNGRFQLFLWQLKLWFYFFLRCKTNGCCVKQLFHGDNQLFCYVKSVCKKKNLVKLLKKATPLKAGKGLVFKVKVKAKTSCTSIEKWKDALIMVTKKVVLVTRKVGFPWPFRIVLANVKLMFMGK